MKNTSKSYRSNKFFPLLVSSTVCCFICLPLVYGETLETPPVITSLTPSKSLAKAETLITIYGDGIRQGASVKIGKRSVIPMAYFPPKSLTVYSPPGKPGSVDVTLTNPDGQLFVLEEGFQYVRSMSDFTDRDKPVIEINRLLPPPLTLKERLKNFFVMHRAVILKAGVFGGLFCFLLLLFSFSRRRRVIKKIRREGRYQ